MAKSKIQEAAYDKIGNLVEHFASQIEALKKKQKEAETRIMYINPLFDALGWDIDNTKLRLPVSYKDVIHEDELKIGGKTKAPDYCFTNYGKRTFFLEAKKPSVLIKTDTDPSYQLRRYGWSAKLPISILTDFEEFAMYDCSKQPKENDATTVGRLKYITYDQYLKEFDWIWDLFSKEQVVKGSLEQFAKADKKGTQSVDYAFLQSLDEWRNLLATNIAIRNKQLNEDDINYIVQMNINRIVFLRNCEDRGAEAYGKLKDCLVNAKEEGGYFSNMHRLFDEADRKYNSGLFDFSKDTLSKSVAIDNKVISTIVSELYYPKSPYEFSVIGAEILGTAYERFLGKVIRLTAGHQAKVEEKPEVRKAGGVFYTPQYIVEYIVKNTVGKLVEGKTPEEIEKIKICDPACGSGSFLLGAYQFLLNYHTDWYTKNYKKSRNVKDSPLTPEGNLSTQIKKEILLNNIYGVDLDAQAGEVTKLSLLMKCMEGETAASMQTTLTFERVLPTLDNNIKSGNSLIDFDFYEEQLDFGEDRKINPFNWKNSFSQVFKQGGFDAIIGNPPWVDLKGHPAEQVKYYFKKFATSENRINLYSIFIEKSLQILRSKGLFGFVIPNSLLYQSSYEKMRRLILKDWKIGNIVRLPDNVFYGVKAETIIITIDKSSENTDCLLYDRADSIHKIESETAKENKVVNSILWNNNEFAVFDIFSNESQKDILEKIERNKTALSELCDFTLGITPYDKYKGHTPKQIDERVFHSTTKKDKTFKPLLEGADVKRYSVDWGQKEYISYGDWLGAARQHKFFKNPRILIRQIVSGKPLRIYAGYTEEELYNVQSVFNVIVKEDKDIDLKYLLGLINSTLMNFYHGYKYLDMSKNLFQKILIQNCKKFPIKIINQQDKKELQLQSEIIKLVNQLLQNIQDIKQQTVQSKREQIIGRMTFAEQKIDELVYELYDLTKEEIQIIESQ